MRTRVTGWISQGPNVAFKVDLTFETTLSEEEIEQRFRAIEERRRQEAIDKIEERRQPEEHSERTRSRVERIGRGEYFGRTFRTREEIEEILKGAPVGSRFEIDYEFGVDRAHPQTIIIETVEPASMRQVVANGHHTLSLLARGNPGTDRPVLRRYLSARMRSLTPIRLGPTT